MFVYKPKGTYVISARMKPERDVVVRVPEQKIAVCDRCLNEVYLCRGSQLALEEGADGVLCEECARELNPSTFDSALRQAFAEVSADPRVVAIREEIDLLLQRLAEVGPDDIPEFFRRVGAKLEEELRIIDVVSMERTQRQFNPPTPEDN